MGMLKKHLPFSGEAGLQELEKIAVRFEQKIYGAATSESDYLRKISLKMLTMETKDKKTMANSLQFNAASTSENTQELKRATSIRSRKRKKEHEIDTTGTIDVELIPKICQLAERSKNAASKDQLEEIVRDLYNLHLNRSERLDANKLILHASELITKHLSDFEDPKIKMMLKDDDDEVLLAMKMQTWICLVNLGRGLL